MDLKFKYEDKTSKFEGVVLEYINGLPKNEIFFDLGSCLGYFSLHAYKRGLKVFSFEVEPKNFNGLKENILINDLEKEIKIFNIGISDGTKKEMFLSIGQDKIGGHHKTLDTKNFTGSDGIKNSNYKKIKVQVDSLDNIIEKYDLPYPQHLKIDIDGSEYDFINGANETLSKAKSLMIELYEKNNLFNEILNKLFSYDFKLIKKEEIVQPWGVCKNLFNYEFRKV